LAQFPDLIDYHRIGPDGGQSAAINEGWANLSARHYGWLNDDDMLHPDATTRALALFAQGAAVVNGRTDILEEGVLRVGYGQQPIGPRILYDNTIAQPSTFVTHEALAAIDLQTQGTVTRSVDPDKHYAMDWDLWRRLYKSGATFATTSDVLSITRWYDGTKTASLDPAKYREYADLLRQDCAWPRTAWTLINMAIHNLATYGRAAPLFRPLQWGLEAAYALRNGPSEAASEADATLDVFHYADQPEQLFIEQAQGLDQDLLSPIKLDPAQAVKIDSHALRVSFD
jgi:hypothetical protein